MIKINIGKNAVSFKYLLFKGHKNLHFEFFIYVLKNKRENGQRKLR